MTDTLRDLDQQSFNIRGLGAAGTAKTSAADLEAAMNLWGQKVQQSAREVQELEQNVAFVSARRLRLSSVA